jgi:hypothetical protein
MHPWRTQYMNAEMEERCDAHQVERHVLDHMDITYTNHHEHRGVNKQRIFYNTDLDHTLRQNKELSRSMEKRLGSNHQQFYVFIITGLCI